MRFFILIFCSLLLLTCRPRKSSDLSESGKRIFDEDQIKLITILELMNPIARYTLNVRWKYEENEGLLDADVPDLWGIYRVGADLAHKDFSLKASSQTHIGVLDQGFDNQLPAIREQTAGFFGKQGFTREQQYHGTHVSGTIGANANFGIAFPNKIRLFPASYIPSDFEGVHPMLDDLIISKDYQRTLIEAVKFFGDHKSVRAVSMSLKFGDNEAFAEGIIDKIKNSNKLFIAASGNSREDISFNSKRYNETLNILHINALAEYNNRAVFTNYGEGTFLSAPGVNIYSLNAGIADSGNKKTKLKTSKDYNGNSSSLVALSGTSMAAPHVAGAIAAIASVNPKLNSAQIIEVLKATAIDLGKKGRDPFYGFGLLNVYGAVALAEGLQNKELQTQVGIMRKNASELYIQGIKMLLSAVTNFDNEKVFESYQILRRAHFLDPNHRFAKSGLYIANKYLGFTDDANGMVGELISQYNDSELSDYYVSTTKNESDVMRLKVDAFSEIPQISPDLSSINEFKKFLKTVRVDNLSFADRDKILKGKITSAEHYRAVVEAILSEVSWERRHALKYSFYDETLKNDKLFDSKYWLLSEVVGTWNYLAEKWNNKSSNIEIELVQRIGEALSYSKVGKKFLDFPKVVDLMNKADFKNRGAFYNILKDLNKSEYKAVMQGEFKNGLEIHLTIFEKKPEAKIAGDLLDFLTSYRWKSLGIDTFPYEYIDRFKQILQRISKNGEIEKVYQDKEFLFIFARSGIEDAIARLKNCVLKGDATCIENISNFSKDSSEVLLLFKDCLAAHINNKSLTRTLEKSSSDLFMNKDSWNLTQEQIADYIISISRIVLNVSDQDQEVPGILNELRWFNVYVEDGSQLFKLVQFADAEIVKSRFKRLTNQSRALNHLTSLIASSVEKIDPSKSPFLDNTFTQNFMRLILISNENSEKLSFALSKHVVANRGIEPIVFGFYKNAQKDDLLFYWPQEGKVLGSGGSLTFSTTIGEAWTTNYYWLYGKYSDVFNEIDQRINGVNLIGNKSDLWKKMGVLNEATRTAVVKQDFEKLCSVALNAIFQDSFSTTDKIALLRYYVSSNLVATDVQKNDLNISAIGLLSGNLDSDDLSLVRNLIFISRNNQTLERLKKEIDANRFPYDSQLMAKALVRELESRNEKP